MAAAREPSDIDGASGQAAFADHARAGVLPSSSLEESQGLSHSQENEIKQQAVDSAGDARTSPAQVHDHDHKETYNEEVTVATAPLPHPKNYLSGSRLHFVTFAILLCLFLINVEISIVGTALNSIANDLNGFEQSSWVVTGFLLSFVAFINIFAKFSDVWGRKPMILVATLIFLAFSGACAGASSMNMLILFRVLQGVGAGGIYSTTILAIYELVPSTKLGIYSALCSLALTIAAAVAPIMGGAIADHTTWRWVFLLMCPSAFIAALVFFFLMPGDYPKNSSSKIFTRPKSAASENTFFKIDFLGAILLLAAVICLNIGLFEASSTASWSSAIVIGFLVAAFVTWILFNLWERRLTLLDGVQQPILPWRFYFHRPWLGMLLLSFVLGVPFNFLIVTWPQRFQIVLQDTPLNAGFRLLPYIVTSSIASMILNLICGRTKIAFIWVFFATGICQLIGFILLAVYSLDPSAWIQYFALALCGIGVGGTYGTLALATPFVVEKRDLAAGTGAILQFRHLGGIIGLAIATAILNSYLRSHLAEYLSGDQIDQVLSDSNTIALFDTMKQSMVRNVYLDAYSLQIKVMCGISSAQSLLPLMLLKRSTQFRCP